MAPNEPYWRTNSSFSPPPTRWDFRFQSEGLPSYSVNDDSVQLYRSSTSSNDKGSRGWVRGNHLYDLHYSASDGTGIFLSSPSDLSQGPQWTPPAIQEISIENYETSTRKDSHPSVGRVSFTPNKEGTSLNPNSRGSTSSQSETSESESTTKSHLSSQRNFSNLRSFLSKPIHPMSFNGLTTRDAFDPAVTDFTEFDTSTPLRDDQRWSSASSSQEFADVTESFELETPGRSHFLSDGFRCGLCERFLSQRSPWSSRRIVRSGDMPTIGVLPCCHAFHAECLDQTTPKTRKSDPPCPVCVKLEEENSPDQQRGHLRLRTGFPRLKSSRDDGPSRPWGCVQVGDCVEGALHAPPRNTMLLLNRNRIKKNLSSKGNMSKEFPGKVKKNGTFSSQLFGGNSADGEAVGCSKATAGPSVWR